MSYGLVIKNLALETVIDENYYALEIAGTPAEFEDYGLITDAVTVNEDYGLITAGVTANDDYYTLDDARTVLSESSTQIQGFYRHRITCLETDHIFYDITKAVYPSYWFAAGGYRQFYSTSSTFSYFIGQQPNLVTDGFGLLVCDAAGNPVYSSEDELIAIMDIGYMDTVAQTVTINAAATHIYVAGAGSIREYVGFSSPFYEVDIVWGVLEYNTTYMEYAHVDFFTEFSITLHPYFDTAPRSFMTAKLV